METLSQDDEKLSDKPGSECRHGIIFGIHEGLEAKLSG